MEFEESPRPTKRFRHQSYKASLKEVHLPSALKKTDVEDDIEETQSAFHEALNHWRELNLAPAFLKFASQTNELSLSMGLLLHNWQEIVDRWCDAMASANDEALKPLLDLFQKLLVDLQSTLSPAYEKLLDQLLSLLPKTIPALVLTDLLSTFSSFFRYLLIASSADESSDSSARLTVTWSALAATLPNCNPEVQRAMAEAWGAVLRRLKGGARTEALNLISRDLEGIQDTSAWMIVSACKSVSQTLHTSSTPIFASLLDFYFSIPEEDDAQSMHVLLRRILIALGHHVKDAESYTPLSNALLKRFESIIEASSTPSSAVLGRLLSLLSISCSVRGGSRVSQDSIGTLFRHMPSISYSPELHISLSNFAVAVLNASNLPLWATHARTSFEHTWSYTSDGSFSLNIAGTLSDLNWAGWRVAVLPSLLRRTSELLERVPGQTLGLLAALEKEGRLTTTDVVWRQRVGAWIEKSLDDWTLTEESVFQLRSLTSLSPIVSIPSEKLLKILQTILTAPGAAREEFQCSPANSAVILGTCFEVLSTTPTGKLSSSVDMKHWVEKVASNWGWSSFALSGLVAFAQAHSARCGRISVEAIYPHLHEALSSHVRSLRLSALRLLSCSIVEYDKDGIDMVQRCLQAEEVAPDVQGVRERVLRITRLEPGLRDGDERGAEFATRWLTAQLKVNLRPLWKPACDALAQISQRFGDVVWRHLFNSLSKLVASGHELAKPYYPYWMDDSEGGDDRRGISEEEFTWRDPSAHRVLVLVNKWNARDNIRRCTISLQKHSERLDDRTFEENILSALGTAHWLPEKHNREVVSLFFSLQEPKDGHLALSKHKLAQWLTLFSKFTNPKAVYATDRLHELYTSLLAMGDRNIQTLSLTCLFGYKHEELAQKEDILRALLDDTKWREALIHFDFRGISGPGRPKLIDTVIRILFGLMLDRRGRARGVDRRAAILPSLAGCTNEELGLVVDLMLRPFLPPGDTLASIDSSGFEAWDLPETCSDSQKVGFLNLLAEVLRHLGPRIVAKWPALISTTLNLVAHAQKRLGSERVATLEEVDSQEEDEHEHENENENEGPIQGVTSNTILRTIRQLGLRRLADFFRNPVDFDFGPFMSSIFSVSVSPRLATLEQENTQAPSALLNLLHVWSSQARFNYALVDYDSRVIPKIYNCLVAVNVKPGVIGRVFDIVEHLLVHGEANENIAERVVRPYMSLLLQHLATALLNTKEIASFSAPIAQRQISILSQIAQYASDEEQATTLLQLLLPVLRKSHKLVNEKVKTNILTIVRNLLPLVPTIEDASSVTHASTFQTLSSLFQAVRSRQARLALVVAFEQFAQKDQSLQSLAQLLGNLNAYSTRRLEEPDFDRRLAAFATLNEEMHVTLSASHWLPVLYNSLYFVQDPEELSIRTNAALSLRLFIERVAVPVNEEFERTFLRVLYPALKNGLRTKSDIVRAEVLGVLAHGVKHCQNIPPLQEMRPLLADGDEEADFFNNILHVQVHRRTRALRRLAQWIDEGQIRSATLAEVFIPLIGNFISTPNTDHHLVNEAITTTGYISRHLAWGAYNTLVRHHLKLLREKDEMERIEVRVVVSILDGFHFQMDSIVDEPVVDKDDEGDQDESLTNEQLRPSISTKITDAVCSRLLPSLLRHLENRKEADDAVRIPIAAGIVKVALHLPENPRKAQLEKLLTVLSQVFRSKSQETRDLTRETLCRIAVMLGPAYLHLIIRELRGALLRGPHLYILAFTVHHVLAHVTTGDHAPEFAELDSCVGDAVHIFSEVVFGEAAKDVQSEDFKTKMREVRTAKGKGLDAFTILSRHVSSLSISGLLLPLRAIIQETASHKVLQDVDEVFHRITTGLNANPRLSSPELLLLCHSLISQNAKFLKEAPRRPKAHGKKSDAIVQLKRKVATDANNFANNSFRFIVFGLDLLNTAFKRGKFDLQNPQIIARLDPMVAVVGNVLYSDNAQVLIQGLKAATSISKLPLKSVGKSLPVYIRQMLDMLVHAGSTESEVAQASLKALASVMRDCPEVQVKEKDLVYLLEFIGPDLEEPARQAAVFAILRAVVARRFVVPEIYDMMDKVSEVMVTNQSPQVREHCRGIVLQFLLDYPQGKGRLQKHMAFLVKNLSYVHESGRKSVMELLGAVISKFNPPLVLEYSDLIFIGLVMVLVNDDSAQCKEMAASLIQSLLLRLDEERREQTLKHLHSWASQRTQPRLCSVAAQVYGLVVDALDQAIQPYEARILGDLSSLMRQSAAQILETDTEAGDSDPAVEWQTPYQALVAAGKLIRKLPSLASKNGPFDWRDLTAHLLFPHAWVRLAASRVLGQLFSGEDRKSVV